MTPQNFATLAALLHAGSGLVVGPDKQYLLETRLAPILRQHGMRDLDTLAVRLRGSLGGRTALEFQVIEAMTTNESFFFRDDKPFAHVRTSALPRLHASRPAGARLRIWSAAASSGQEAYSLAMLLAGRSVEILGTDLSRAQLARARAGLYSQFEVQRGLPMQYLDKYFTREGAHWRVSEAIRAMVSFRERNLLTDPRPLGMFDLVFCRNVLIYFDQPTRKRVLDGIARQMAPDGLLYLGAAERMIGPSTSFTPVSGERGVYQLAQAPEMAK